MPEKDAATYRYDITDVTKIWPHADYPLIPIGRLVINKNVQNFFAEVEQVAFSPGNLVPGIELSNDRVLQSRVFAYPDAQRYRLGPNFEKIPVNCPINSVNNPYMRDGAMNVSTNGSSQVNYEPNSHGGPTENPHYELQETTVQGTVARRDFDQNGDIDFEQPRALWVKVLTPQGRDHLVSNILRSLKVCKPDIKERMINLCSKVHPDFG